MSKRPADTNLEIERAEDGAPLTPKRARVEDIPDEEFAAVPNEKILEASRPRAPVQPTESADGREDGMEEGVDSEEESALTAVVRNMQVGPAEGFSDLYLDTVNR